MKLKEKKVKNAIITKAGNSIKINFSKSTKLFYVEKNRQNFIFSVALRFLIAILF